ncbi:MAG: dTDP-4-dehydrorhamnose 3,5-epimerase family protein [Proteobacteria bacterium]|nr:dTDP-4-dehydrorhamnose 3,5-epimerase family protein [Pseudomonadota bacterium]MBU1649806.1 dTDP-4-dehydrorhamnose 3,5-epimerase family protein [Pseudomonadota bacterium]
MNRFLITKTPLIGLIEVQRQQLTDTRGFLSRLFSAEEFFDFGWHKSIAQINHTSTVHRGTIRGMHFQHPPHSEMKLISCLRGEVWDVAVDIRFGSPTFLCWHGVTLSAKNCRALLIPEGFAHGFQTLTDEVELLYCHSVAYCASFEGGLHPEDPRLSIKWPLPVTEISDRDKSHSFISHNFKGVSP